MAMKPAWDSSPLLELAQMLRRKGVRPPNEEVYTRDDEHWENVPVFTAKKCSWGGEKGRMIKLYPNEAFPLCDNLFDPFKFEYFVRVIKQARHVIFPCCVAVVAGIVRPMDVIESAPEYDGTGLVWAEAQDVAGPWPMPMQGVRWTDKDIGHRKAQVRNGNHRCFAAFAAGEPYVWAFVINAGGMQTDA